MSKFLKINLILLLLTFSSSSLVLASFSIPSYVYKVSQLNSARSVAKKTNKPIAFVYSNKKTDCGLATAASKDLFKGLKNYSVVVYAERKDWNKLPHAVQNSINSPEAGKFIPKTIVVDSGCRNMICVIPYAKTKQRRQLIKQAQKILSRY